MKIPDLTSRQFLALSLLLDGEISGRALREKLAEHRDRSSGPAFYQFMSRLEDAKFVESRYQQKTVERQALRETFYKITYQGIRVWEEARDFFVTHARLGMGGAWS